MRSVSPDRREDSQTVRGCAIDIGSNSVRCLVADVSAGGAIATVARGLEITRLSDRMGTNALLRPAALERTVSAVQRFLALGRQSGAQCFTVFGTWALREARNAASFLAAVRGRTGCEVRILTEEEEASLAYRGATRALHAPQERVSVLDIGGGSAELISGGEGGAIRFSSLPLGCVMMTERFFLSDPPAERDMASMRRFVDRMLKKEIGSLYRRTDRLIGAGGTITTAAALSLGLTRYDPERIHGARVAAAGVCELIARLSEMPFEQRKHVRGLEPKRADIIVAGLIVLDRFMKYLGTDPVIVSDEGILHGAILELLV